MQAISQWKRLLAQVRALLGENPLKRSWESLLENPLMAPLRLGFNQATFKSPSLQLCFCHNFLHLKPGGPMLGKQIVVVQLL